MALRLYDELASWWPLLSAPADYAEEAGLYVDAIRSNAAREVRTLLELGSGGGNNASHMKEVFDVVLTDLSPAMLRVSSRLNPECEHIEGDMRTLRLGRRFDAVMIQDAVMYMTSERDLSAAIATAAEHLEPGGVALFVPDNTTETFRPGTSDGGHDGEDRSLRYLQWEQPPRGNTFDMLMFYALSEDGSIHVEWEVHKLGLFPRSTWLRLIADAGLEPRVLPYPHSSFECTHEMFAGLKV